MAEYALSNTSEYTIWRDDAAKTTRFEPKPGSPEYNRQQLVIKAEQAIATLEQADDNWATLTAAQKDAATRLAVRASAKLARLAINRLEAN